MDGPIPFTGRSIDRKVERHAEADLTLRKPTPEDGAAVNDLIARCKPLDENSVYCNLLQCSHFAETCVLAELDGEPIGFVSGYIVPEEPETFFVWQVAVAPEARGLSLAKRMILDILRRENLEEVKELHTTITPDNKPSQGVFSSVARTLESDVEREVMFCEEQHFDGEGKTEVLWRIGPFDREELLPELERQVEADEAPRTDNAA